jgi:hypothetical protein
MGNETLFLSSSLTLLAISCVSLVLALLFRSKLRTLNVFANNPTVNVFNKTFNVFDPYPDSKKLVNAFLTALPLLVLFCTGFVLFIFMEILAAGLLLNLIVVIISINLLVVDGVFEVYQNGGIFISAFRREIRVGEGDVRVLQIVKKALSRISTYYFGLAIFFAIFGFTLQYTILPVYCAFSGAMDLIFQVDTAMGYPPYTIPLFWMMIIVVITFFVRKIKKEFLKAIYTG